MEKNAVALKTPPSSKTPIQSENTQINSKTPPLPPPPKILLSGQKSQNSGNESRMTGPTPDRLKVPKAFKFPERYTSPTDLMMSPISKGLLARSRKPRVVLPQSKNQPKIQDLIFQEVGVSQT